MKRGDLLNELEALREQAFFAREQASSLSDVADRVERGVQDIINKLSETPPPSQIQYDRSKMDEPPRVRPSGPMCGHDEPAVLKTLTSKKTGNPYDVWVCARPRDEQCEMWQFPER